MRGGELKGWNRSVHLRDIGRGGLINEGKSRRGGIVECTISETLVSAVLLHSSREQGSSMQRSGI